MLAAHAKPSPAVSILPQKQRFRLGPSGLKETKKRNRKGKDASKEIEQSIPSSNNSNHNALSKGYDIVTSRAGQYGGVVEGPGIDSLPRSADAGHGVLDPFGALPIIVCHRVQILLYQGQFHSHCISHFRLGFFWYTYQYTPYRITSIVLLPLTSLPVVSKENPPSHKVHWKTPTRMALPISSRRTAPSHDSFTFRRPLSESPTSHQSSRIPNGSHENHQQKT